MTSKKPAQQKRAKLPRRSDRTSRFVKDWERLSHSGRYDMRHLKDVMLLLIANDAQLPPEYRDHELVGEWEGFAHRGAIRNSRTFRDPLRVSVSDTFAFHWYRYSQWPLRTLGSERGA